MNTTQSSDQGPAHCGSKPKRLAIGIAPLGTVSIGIVPMGVVCIGIVPMGVVCIGIVPMGVVSIGLVAMGVINFSIVGMGLLAVGVNTMGVWTAGPMSMGLVRMGTQPGSHDHHGGQGSEASAGDDPRTLAYPTREQAEDQAKSLGCQGAHRMGDFWMPCSEHPQDYP